MTKRVHFARRGVIVTGHAEFKQPPKGGIERKMVVSIASRPLVDPSKHPPAKLREIRASATNFKGEMRR